MHQPNIRLYLILSGILVIILVAIFIIPLGRRGVNQPPGETVPTPTSIATAPIDEPGSTVATVDFTGVAEEELPDNVAEQTSQKQDLRYRTPLTLCTFVIDFGYNQLMLNVFKKMFGIAKKAILVFIVFASILTLFFYFINKDKITLTVDPTEQGRQQIYQIINDKQLKSSQGGQLFIALVLVLVAIGFMIMFRMKINAQTVISVENALPRIIIALILITFSYPIAGFMIDLMYLFFLLVVSVLSSVGIDNYTPANTYNLLNEYIAAGPGKLWPLNFNWLNTGNYLLAILPVGAGVLKFIAGFLVSFGLSKLFWNWTKLDMTVEGFKDTAVQVLSFGFGLGDLPSWIGTAIF